MITSIRPQSFFPNPFNATNRAAFSRPETPAAQTGKSPEPVEHHLKPLQELTQAMNRLDYMVESPVFQEIE